SSLIRFQNRQERFLRDFDLADLLHAFLTGGLLGPQFALAGDVAAVALGRHVLLDGSDGLASNNPAADGRLNSDLEQMPINFAAEFLYELTATALGKTTMNNRGQGIHTLARHQNVQTHEVRLAVAEEVIIHRAVAVRYRFQLVVKIVDDF